MNRTPIERTDCAIHSSFGVFFVNIQGSVSQRERNEHTAFVLYSSESSRFLPRGSNRYRFLFDCRPKRSRSTYTYEANVE